MPVLSEPVTDGSVLGAMSPCCWWHPSFASLESVTLCMGHLLTTTMSFDLISPVTYLLQRLSFTPTVSSLHSLFTSCWASSPSERIAKTMGGVGSSQHQQTEPWNIPSWKRPIKNIEPNSWLHAGPAKIQTLCLRPCVQMLFEHQQLGPCPLPWGAVPYPPPCDAKPFSRAVFYQQLEHPSQGTC